MPRRIHNVLHIISVLCNTYKAQNILQMFICNIIICNIAYYILHDK